MPQHIISLAMVAISRKNPDFSPVSVSCVFSFKKRRRRFDKSPFCPFSRRRQRRNQYEGLLYKIKPFFRKMLNLGDMLTNEPWCAVKKTTNYNDRHRYKVPETIDLKHRICVTRVQELLGSHLSKYFRVFMV